MSQPKQDAPAGRLAGKKSPTYVRAVNEPEARASRFTARYMLVSDIAYVLSAAMPPRKSSILQFKRLYETIVSAPEVNAWPH